jgi:hypothetical protein
VLHRLAATDRRALLSLAEPPKPQSPFRLFDVSQRVADLPERGCPEPDEEGAPLGIAALVLVDGLGADPEADAEADGAERERVELRAAQPSAMQRVDDHPRAVPVPTAFIRALVGLSLRRRLSTAALWPVGIALTSWHYMWRTTPMHRSEERGRRDDLAPRLPEATADDDVQRLEDGVGPLFHRLYRARIRDARLSPQELIARLSLDPNVATPTELARFLKIGGATGPLAVGDELVVRMPGPWDGPVRVIMTTPTAFRFATLSGHLEAGQIEFRATRSEGLLQFEIESWARSGDRFSNLLYHHLRMAKEVQLHMWTSFLEQVAHVSEGRLTGGVEIISRKVEDPRALS